MNSFDILNDNTTIDLTEKKEIFQRYFELLIEWNEKINLTAILEKNEVYEKHFLDSIILEKYFDLNDINSICDIGAGAGFPSIPLKICFPHLKITIVDSLQKRINFLEVLVKELKLDNVTLIADRAEEFAKNNRESFDLVTARGVARLNILNELCIPIVKKNGYFITYKGMNGMVEHEEALNGIHLLGAKFINNFHYELPIEKSHRELLIYQKVKSTNYKYPRNFGIIKKKPL